MNERILIADDEEIFRENVKEFLESSGYSVDAICDGREAIRKILEGDYALLLADIRMPELDGIALLRRVIQERPDTFVILMTAYASVDTAVEALRLGAYDYLLKPIVFEDLLKRVQNLFEYRAVKEEVLRLRHVLSDRLGFEGIVGDSPEMRKVFSLVERVAPTDATVLLTGESGTGKELVARAIHTRSRVADKEFLAVNMAAIPRETVESQLFGHEKGAFTGADRQRNGLLRSVRGGTIFLDEVGELPRQTQPKLLRALELHEVLPIGSDRPSRAEFRMIAATNRDLERDVSDGRFRQDLYYRLNVFHIPLPPLRDRREDIPALVTHFVSLHSRALGRKPRSLSSEARRVFLTYAWPGNVRELSNVIERACILCGEGTLEVEHLPSELVTAEALPMGLKEAVEEFERRHIGWVLRASGRNREKAAAMLGIDPATLYRRLARFRLKED